MTVSDFRASHLGAGQYELPIDPARDDSDISFLHKSFCIAGLALRKPKNDQTVWRRYDDRFALTVQPSNFTLPGGAEVTIGVPYGPKARLLAIWLATEVHNPRRREGDTWIEIGHAPSWLRSIGIQPRTGQAGNTNITKDQLVRLTFSEFTMVLKHSDQELFKRDNLIDAAVFGAGQIEAYRKGNLGQMDWPAGIQLTQAAYERMRRHSVPIPSARLHSIAHSAMAIDIFVYLSYTLPQISPGESQLVRWRDLIAQFGSNESPSKFVETFETSIRQALQAYREADVELTEEGLQMRYSDPAVLRKPFVAVGGSAVSARSPKGEVGLSKRRRQTIAKRIERDMPEG
ncbi:replication protein RepA [Rhodovibrio sodomensis]|nr:replication protein RepA [Rhodovibrio sodomensis]